MLVASLQMEINDEQSKKNRIELAEKLLTQEKEADLLLLPEIWNTGYFNFEKYEEESESLSGPSITAISEKAAEINSYVFAGSIVEEDEGDYYNTSVMLNPEGEIIATYRKLHLFGYGSAETEVLTPGEEVVTVDTELGTLGLSTCYDLRFPELYRKMLDQGAEIFLITSGWPFPRVDNWKTLNKSRAAENLSYLISCNCAGNCQGTQFLGHSMIVNPWGNTIASSAHRPTVVKAEIDLEKVEHVRNEFPSLQDRKLDQ